MFEHQDILNTLNNSAPLAEKLRSIRNVVAHRFPFVTNVVVTVYDADANRLKTFAQASADSNMPLHYETEIGSLQELIDQQRPRVLNDLEAFAKQEGHDNTRKVAELGVRSSYTMPMFLNSTLFGFLFFNSDTPDRFNDENLEILDVFGHLVSLTVVSELSSIRTLLASIQAARDLTHHRDIETGAHVSRTAGYARLIARELATSHGFDDDYIEHIFLFSPLHDVGKIGVPDSVLLKKGRLDESEFEVMKTHANKGREIIDSIIDQFGLAGVEHVDLLRNIAQFHHEAMDGSGYPSGLKGEEIPIEARIMCVADIFDALTSTRPYKQAWSNDDAFAQLNKLSGVKLDPDCVTALANNREEVERIQKLFKEELLG